MLNINFSSMNSFPFHQAYSEAKEYFKHQFLLHTSYNQD